MRHSGLRCNFPVAFYNTTLNAADHLLRHPSFEGLREGKPAREVKFERPSQKGS